MELTSKQKMYASIVGLCLTVLLVDKMFLGPGEASAQDHDRVSDFAVPRPSEPPAAAEVAVDTDLTAGQRIFARRLESVAADRAFDLGAVPDAFEPSSAWPSLDDGSMQTTIEVGSPAYVFRTNHRLTAVMAGRGGGYAIVDGKGLRVGESLDGYTLISVNDASAVFASDGVRVELTVNRGSERHGE